MIQGEGLSLEVWAEGAREWYWQTHNPTAIPRLGEFVYFTDGRGRVDRVDWYPRPGEPLLVKVMCVRG